MRISWKRGCAKAKTSTVHRPRTRSSIKSLGVVIGALLLVFQHAFPDREQLQHTALPPLCYPSASKLATVLSSKKYEQLNFKIELFSTRVSSTAMFSPPSVLTRARLSKQTGVAIVWCYCDVFNNSQMLTVNADLIREATRKIFPIYQNNFGVPLATMANNKC